MIVDTKRAVVADSETQAEIPRFDLKKDNQQTVQALQFSSDLKKNRAPTLALYPIRHRLPSPPAQLHIASVTEESEE
jgi:hypothetical protein